MNYICIRCQRTKIKRNGIKVQRASGNTAHVQQSSRNANVKQNHSGRSPDASLKVTRKWQQVLARMCRKGNSWTLLVGKYIRIDMRTSGTALQKWAKENYNIGTQCHGWVYIQRKEMYVQRDHGNKVVVSWKFQVPGCLCRKVSVVHNKAGLIKALRGRVLKAFTREPS